ncbi:MAG TPA: hypothetical protein GX401_06510 [Clostridiales bacterium]|nr:hypothetical protein [Clostridiales bacterium]
MDKNHKQYPIVSDEYINQVLKTGPRDITLAGAEQYIQDIKSHVSSPSEYGVEEMRNWSIENEK